MKYCSHCGAQIQDEAVVCVACGCSVAAQRSEPDVPSKELNIVSCLLPIVGLILFIIYQEKSPIKAKEIGKWALIGVCIEAALSGLVWFLGA